MKSNMFDLIKYPLLPILLPQALWAKWRTPRLPEASGERHGQIGTGQPLRLLILGDSAGAGVGTDRQDNALAGQLSQQLSEQGYAVDWQLIATTGHSLTDLLETLLQLPTQTFDVVVISSGVNDILKQSSLLAWQHNCIRLYRQLQQQCDQPVVIFSAVPPIHKFSALPGVLAWYVGEWAKRFNQCLAQLSKSHEHFYLLEADFPLTADYLANDGFHPSAKAYTLWAQSVVELINSKQLLRHFQAGVIGL